MVRVVVSSSNDLTTYIYVPYSHWYPTTTTTKIKKSIMLTAVKNNSNILSDTLHYDPHNFFSKMVENFFEL